MGEDEEDPESGEGEEGGPVSEEQKILVLTEEGREKIREARKKVNAEENAIIDKIILDEKLMVLQRLKLDGVISDEEFETKKAEIIEESGLKELNIILTNDDGIYSPGILELKKAMAAIWFSYCCRAGCAEKWCWPFNNL